MSNHSHAEATNSATPGYAGASNAMNPKFWSQVEVAESRIQKPRNLSGGGGMVLLDEKSQFLSFQDQKLDEIFFSQWFDHRIGEQWGFQDQNGYSGGQEVLFLRSQILPDRRKKFLSQKFMSH